uniref:Haloacid dehalogenase domain-containing protein hydrolase n=1 Tax=uncultured bacterium Contig12 TaxID=1393397 RepID=W0FMQ6_9BACT|nr:haloacid dehalogenase domain-containing protein hydrolase [uncultured bacterium Contig12]
MAGQLMRHLLSHPFFFRELMGIYHFRKIRETEDFRTRPLEAQIREAASLAGIRDADRLKDAIQTWMFDKPLRCIRKYGNQDTLSLMEQLRSEGKRILIYSDYAPEQKLEALGIHADGVYYPGVHGIEGLKPSGKNVHTILSAQALCPEEAVFIGDRPEKDGESARAAGVRFIPV